jgi:hypothetical protein
VRAPATDGEVDLRTRCADGTRHPGGRPDGRSSLFFLHLTTAPDNTNNILALAFGIFIVCLVVFGSVWIMGHLNHHLMPMNQLMEMQH